MNVPPQVSLDPLASPSLGTATNDLVEPCAVREPRAADPPAPEKDPAFALALSGGGFRATFTALGVLRFLADAGLLAQVRYSSSVSGGSVANGLFAHAYDKLEQRQFGREAVDELMIAPAIERATKRSLQLTVILNLWRAIGPKTRTGVLADLFDRWFYHGHTLTQLPRGCRFVFNASNLTTGVRFGFERDVIGDYVLGRVPTDKLPRQIRLADAVAASAAFPGAFAPVELKGIPFPCAQGRIPKLLDGGAYDNLGLEVIDDLKRHVCLIGVNAGGTFRTGSFGWLPLISALKRANSLLYRQTVSLRMSEMVERFKAWEQAPTNPPPWARRGVLFSLATTIDDDKALEWRQGRPEHPELRIPLAETKTSFAKFTRERAHQLIYRGWWLAGATLSEFHRGLLDGLPSWDPP